MHADRALHALLGIERFPGTDTVRNAHIQQELRLIEHCQAPGRRVLKHLISQAAREFDKNCVQDGLTPENVGNDFFQKRLVRLRQSFLELDARLPAKPVDA